LTFYSLAGIEPGDAAWRLLADRQVLFQEKELVLMKIAEGYVHFS